MHFAMIQRIVGLLLMVLSVTMLPPIGVALFYGDGALYPFVETFVISLATSLLVWWPVRKVDRDLTLRDGCLVVALFWLVFGIYGALPLYLAHEAWLTYTDAAFETVSGLTTTGATTVTGLDDLPHALLYYRAQLQFLGGGGIIVLAVAILPMLGVGGMSLYRAETPGPIKDTKLTPRIRETAKALWTIYVALNVVCALAYWLAGMTVFDAICHAFATLSTGGFSTHDASLGFFDSDVIELIAIFFMLAGGASFSLHFLAWRSANPLTYWRDSEFRAYFRIIAVGWIAIGAILLLAGTYSDPSKAFLDAGFHWISLGTSTGFATTDYSVWPGFLPILLVISGCFCACAGSTGAGIKVIRGMLLFKHSMREVMRTVHPNAEIVVKVGDRVVPTRVIEAVCGFFAAYVVIYIVFWLALMALGMDTVSAFAAVSVCFNNMGAGLGEVLSNFVTVDPVSKWLMIFAMLLGRLEIFTLLALLTPAFWRR